MDIYTYILYGDMDMYKSMLKKKPASHLWVMVLQDDFKILYAFVFFSLFYKERV